MRPRLAVKKTTILSGALALCLALALTVCVAGTAQGQTRITPSPFDRPGLHAYGGSRPRSFNNDAVPQFAGYTLHSFTGAPGDGQYPFGGVVEDSNGNVYGTTQAGGASNLGIVFELNAAGTYSVLYSFSGHDGKFPSSSLILDSNGCLYGTTYAGGAWNLGTVFKMAPPVDGSSNWDVTVLYSFSGTPDGGHPIAGLVMDPGGSLYGVTGFGGSNNFGTVFKLNSKGKANETVLYNFAGGDDGAYPLANLVIDPGGSLYGVTTGGGRHGLGTVFQLKQNGKEIVLHSFRGGEDGAAPYYAALLRDSSGNLYGTTYSGGSQTGGTVFEVPVTGNEKVLYYFCGAMLCGDGFLPLGGLTQGTDGLLYGTTAWGGWYYGTIFSLNPTNDQEIVLHDFTDWNYYGDGGQPNGPLVQDKSSGAFYGTTWGGGSTGGNQSEGYGSIFMFTP